VDEYVCEVLRSQKRLALDQPPLLSCGRSAYETAWPSVSPGFFLPPGDAKMHGFVGVDAGFGVGVLHGEVICTEDRLMLVAFVDEHQYERLVDASNARTLGLTALFNGHARARVFYDTVDSELLIPREPLAGPVFVHIPNGLAFMRLIDVGCGQRECCLKMKESSGIFRYYDSLTQPTLHFILQVGQRANDTHASGSPVPHSMVNAFGPASLEALHTFLTNMKSTSTGTNWSGSSCEGQSASASETSTVMAHLVQARTGLPRAAETLSRLERVLCQ